MRVKIFGEIQKDDKKREVIVLRKKQKTKLKSQTKFFLKRG